MKGTYTNLVQPWLACLTLDMYVSLLSCPTWRHQRESIPWCTLPMCVSYELTATSVWSRIDLQYRLQDDMLVNPSLHTKEWHLHMSTLSFLSDDILRRRWMGERCGAFFAPVVVDICTVLEHPSLLRQEDSTGVRERSGRRP